MARGLNGARRWPRHLRVAGRPMPAALVPVVARVGAGLPRVARDRVCPPRPCFTARSVPTGWHHSPRRGGAGTSAYARTNALHAEADGPEADRSVRGVGVLGDPVTGRAVRSRRPPATTRIFTRPSSTWPSSTQRPSPAERCSCGCAGCAATSTRTRGDLGRTSGPSAATPGQRESRTSLAYLPVCRASAHRWSSR